MKSYIERIQKVREEFKAARLTPEYPKNDFDRVTFNCEFLKSKREGEYLIKTSKSNCWSEDTQYIDFSFMNKWFAFSRRSEAQWFSAKEAHEFLFKRKGFKMVKRVDKAENCGR